MSISLNILRCIGLTLVTFSVSLGQDFTVRFEKVSPKKTGIQFKNQLREDATHNILRYEYFYNGGGVAVGDLDNDGLEDLFFTGNMTENKLYKNLGGWKFEDVTKRAGVAGKSTWTTGVSMADVNGDGLLDIYVCYSGNGAPEGRKNELWINQGDVKFVDQAEEMGLADPSNSTQGIFFDMDRDGDLDLYLLNHHIEVITDLEFDDSRKVRHPYAGDKLYRNDSGKFTDISEAAGIKGISLGFGLGVVASDLNGDGWTDLLVTNDYIEPDYLYLNNGDGTFTDRMTDHFQHISNFSMGADIADITNDGLPEVFTLDMLPEDNQRQKLLYGPENYEQYALMIKQDFHHQNMRNMLHLNLGDGYFSEIGQLAGISNTDWSWSALFFDANSDGKKDLYVSNGYYRDYTNRDFLKYKGDYYFKQAIAKQKADTLHLVTSMSSTPLQDYFFENQGDLRFANTSSAAGFVAKNFSSGAAYADLDGDGDLDLVVSHLNEPAGIYENKSRSASWLQLDLKGNTGNRFAIGAKVSAYAGGKHIFAEQYPVRGFQSSSSHTMHLGLGEVTYVDSLVIHWPDQTQSILRSLAVNQRLSVNQEEAGHMSSLPSPPQPLLSPAQAPDYASAPSTVNDFKRQPLLLTMPSHIGPTLAKADLDLDGHPEVFVGGTKGQPGKIFSWIGDSWVPYRGFRSSSDFTDAVAVFHDFNGDGYPDLFLGSGGYHDYLSADEALQDRLYLNDGQGVLIAQGNFPKYFVSTGTALVWDANGDSFPDLFVGAKIVPGRYPESPESKVLINDGRGQFSDQSTAYLPASGKLGMVTAASTQDLNGDGRDDLIVFGEFMKPMALINQDGASLLDRSADYFEPGLSGWWSSLAQVDLDGDGDLDLIGGNFGLNSQLTTGPDKSLRLYVADFDQNGSLDPILECFIKDGYYPYPSRDELLDQMVSMRSRFTDYASYSTARLDEVFSPAELDQASVLEINTLETMYFEHTTEGFKAKALPRLGQAFPVHAILPVDLNGDGHLDLVLGGNQNQTRIRIGKIDAGFGLVLLGNGKGGFSPLTPAQSGLGIKGDIKSLLHLSSSDQKVILIGINQQALQLYRFP